MTIRDLDISARSKACLLNAGYLNVSDLKNITASELRNVRNLNDLAIEEIIEAVKKIDWEEEITEFQFEDEDDFEDAYDESEVELEDEQDNKEDEDLPKVDVHLAKQAYESVEDLDIDFELWDQYWDEDDSYDFDEERIKESLSYLHSREEKVLEVFGDECAVEYCANKNDYYNYEQCYSGTLYECLEEIRKLIEKDENEGLRLVTQRRTYWVGYNYENCLEELVTDIKRIPEPFDESVLPGSYVHFSEKEVNENNFSALWHGLQKVEEKYKKGIIYEYRYSITDWESELCYEQGKYLENVEWVGGEFDMPPETQIPYVTYSKMSSEQLKYYLFWRTNFRKQKYIQTGMMTFYFLCAYELIADFGPFTQEERFQQLVDLYDNFRESGLSHAHWVSEYADLHNLDKSILETQSYSRYARNPMADTEAVINGDFSDIFEVMHSKSKWKIKKSSFLKKLDCLELIREAVTEFMPKVDLLFKENNLCLMDFLVGKYQMVSYQSWPFGGTVWNERVLKRLGVTSVEESYMNSVYLDDCKIYITDSEGNIKRKTSTSIGYCDPYLSEYILKYTEMVFRMHFGYPYLTWPEELVGALKFKFAEGTEYILSVNKDIQARQKKYISLYPAIRKIMNESIDDYFLKNESRVNALKENFSVEKNNTVANASLMKSPALEEIIDFINNSTKDTSILKLLELYEQTTMTTRKTKAKILAPLIWDYWIFHQCKDISYEELKDRVYGNKWCLEGKKAVVDKNYVAALDYLCAGYDPRSGLIKKYYVQELIRDAILLTIKALEKICIENQTNICDLLLGEWGSSTYTIFSASEEVKNADVCESTVNLGDVEIYQMNLTEAATKSEYQTNEDVSAFLIALMKTIDNEFRAQCGYSSFLKVEMPKGMYDKPSIKRCLEQIPEITKKVVKFVISHKTPKEYSVERSTISVGNLSVRSVVPSAPLLLLQYNIASSAVEEAINEFYGITGPVEIPQEDDDILKVDFDLFDLNTYLYRYSLEERESVRLSSVSLNLTRFYDIYDELQERVYDIVNNDVLYNPSWNYRQTHLMKETKGLTGKDLALLTTVAKDPDDFCQWLKWIERGKIVIPKNEPYIQILFHCVINRAVFENEPKKALVLLSEICNYYFDRKDKVDQSAELLLEWTKHYWLVFCPDVNYSDFKRLFKLNITFDNEGGKQYAKEHYLVDTSKMLQGKYVDFYNDTCDYKVVYGSLVKAGYEDLLEKALERVTEGMKSLWNEYDRDFISDLLQEDGETSEKTRPVFYRCILLGKTKKYIQSQFGSRIVSDAEEYSMDYDYYRMLPLLKYEQTEVNNNAGRYLLEYIMKHVEEILRIRVGQSSKFKFSDWQLYELYSYDLYKDNYSTGVIIKEIRKITNEVCDELGV